MATNGSVGAGVVAPIPTVAVDPGQTGALTVVEHTTEVSAFMPVMSIDLALERWESIQRFISRIMTPGEDFGVIPGSKKPSLLKPGAEKLTAFFGLVPTFDVVERIQDWNGQQFGEPFFHYEVRCRLSRADVTRGEGLGSCNSREVKYRYRDAERRCPVCQAPAIIKGKEEWGGGWVCFKKKGGCCYKFNDGDARVEGQQLSRIANPDVADLVNTLLKMAKKRAMIDAVLNTTGASQFFTQDVEDRAAPEPAADPIDTGGAPQGTKQAAQNVAERKITELKAKKAASANPDPQPKPWRSHGEFLALCELMRERVGEVRFNEELDLAGVETVRDFITRQDVKGALTFHRRLALIAEAEGRLQ